MTKSKNDVFEICGVNHLALVCSDMAKTVDFYSGVLGMPLIKTLEMTNGGQHFFFDIGNGDSLAFFYFPIVKRAEPGIVGMYGLPEYKDGKFNDFTSAIGSMNHVALGVPADKIDEYHQKLKDRGIKVTPVWHHNDPLNDVTFTRKKETWLESIYFCDPDGILIEFAAFKRPINPEIEATIPAKKAS